MTKAGTRLVAAAHQARVKIMAASELTTSPTPVTVFSRWINRLDVYKYHPPSSPDDMRDIIMIAKALIQAAGG